VSNIIRELKITKQQPWRRMGMKTEVAVEIDDMPLWEGLPRAAVVDTVVFEWRVKKRRKIVMKRKKVNCWIGLVCLLFLWKNYSLVFEKYYLKTNKQYKIYI
jgi:hypothetical protein